MAVDMFLKLGAIKGEAHDHAHEGEIMVQDWQWGMTQSGTMHIQGGGGSGKVDVGDMSFSKWVDSSTPELMKSVCNGEHHAEAILTCRKAGKNPVEYLKITMYDVLISSIHNNAQNMADTLSEQVSLNFARFKVEYTPQDEKGAAKPAITQTWDILKNCE